MTDNTQPEALRLAEQYDYGDPVAYSNIWRAAVCTELRRLHAENERLSCLCDKWNSECDEFREDNKRLAALVEAQQRARIAELEAQLEAAVAGGVQALSAAPKPTCGKCKGLGYYDEGHEYEDGTMGGGNYVDCERCKPVYREKLPDGKRCLHGCHKSEPCHTAP